MTRACPMVYAPVITPGGVVYDNPCVAHQAGIYQYRPLPRSQWRIHSAIENMHLLGGQGLGLTTGAGEFRATLISAMSVFLGPSKASRVFDEGISTIKESAASGAEEKVKPFVIAALALGAAGVLIGGTALVLSLRRR